MSGRVFADQELRHSFERSQELLAIQTSHLEKQTKVMCEMLKKLEYLARKTTSLEEQSQVQSTKLTCHEKRMCELMARAPTRRG